MLAILIISIVMYFWPSPAFVNDPHCVYEDDTNRWTYQYQLEAGAAVKLYYTSLTQCAMSAAVVD